jgi:hypothetical protein
MLVDVFEVECETERLIDWFAHVRSEVARPLEGAEVVEKDVALGERHGYPHLTDGRRWSAAKRSTWDFLAGKQRLRMLLLAGGQEETLYTATGIGYRIHNRVPCLVRRCRAARARFVTVYDLTGGGAHVKNGSVRGGDNPEVRVKTADGTERFLFGRKKLRKVKR